ncbi:MAG: hypothetical protein PHX09_00945 [Clostridia bacterium]|nr:hypothetical protein [Clostridia bacterium]
MEAFYITVALNVLLITFLLFGFLWGLGRGLKNSVLRLILFLGGVVFAALLSGIISNSLLDISVYIDGNNVTIKEYIVSLITSQESIAELYNASPAIQSLVYQLPALAVNVFVFVILVYVFKFLSWIIYAIAASIRKRKNRPIQQFSDEAYTVQNGRPIIITQVREKKNGFWGGVVSALQSAILLFLTLLPISGFISILNNLDNETVSAQSIVYAEEGAGSEIGGIIRDAVGPEIFGYIEAYSNSFTVKIFGTGGIDLAIFDGLSTVYVSNQRISLRDEVSTFNEIYENVAYLTTLDFENLEYETFDFDRLETAVKTMFTSGVFRSVGVEVLQFYLDEVEKNEDFSSTGYESQIKSLLNILNSSVGDSESASVLEQDLLAAVGVLKVLAQSGFISLIDSPTLDETAILNLLQLNDYELASDILENLFKSPTLKNVTVGAVNLLVEELENQLFLLNNTEEEISGGTATEVVLDRVSTTTVNWTSLKTDLLSIIKNLISLYTEVKDYTIDMPIDGMNVELMLSQSGKLLNIIKDSTLVKDTVNNNNIFLQVLTELNNSEYGGYVNFSLLNNVNWETETSALIDIYNYYKTEIGEVTVFKNLDYANIQTLLNSVLDTKIVGAVKFGVIDLLLEKTALSLDLQNILTKIKTEFSQSYSYISQLKSEIMGIYDAVTIIGKAGLIDSIKSNDYSNITSIIDYLKVLDNGTNTRMDVVLDRLVASDAFKLVFVELFNEALEYLETPDAEMGRVDKSISWLGWNTFGDEIKQIAKYCINILENGNVQNLEDLASYLILVNENFSNTADDLGRILDIFATMNLFTYENGGLTYTIYDNLIEFYLGDIFNLHFATSDNYTDGFWLSEMQILKNAIIFADNEIIDSVNDTSLLELIVNEMSIQPIFDNNLEEENVIIEVLLTSKLLRDRAVDLINELNKGLINLIDASYDSNIVSMSTDLTNESQDIINLINKAKPFKTIASLDEIKNDFTNQKQNLTQLLEQLQYEFNSSGIFAGSYQILANYLTDESNTDDEIVVLIVSILEGGEFGDSLSNYSWLEIFDEVETLLP